MTSHGRATPLLWKTVRKSALKNRRSEYETELIERLHEILPKRVNVTLLADRGFADQKLFAYLDVLGWNVCHPIPTNHPRHPSRPNPAREGVGADRWAGQDAARCAHHRTADKTSIPAVVFKHQKGMKEAWCIATNRVDLGGAGVIKLYARRFTIEETFRASKDNHFGMGLSATHIGSPRRRGREQWRRLPGCRLR